MKEKWNAWDVPYYVTPLPKPPADAAVTGSPTPADASPAATVPGPEQMPNAERHPLPFAVGSLPLAGEGALKADRVMAILLGFAALLAGPLAFVALIFLGYIASFGSTVDPLVPAIVGACVTAIGLTLAVLTYKAAARPAEIIVGGNALQISFPTFSRPLVVPREMVRAVAIDDKPMRPFQNNKRFEIAGPLPGHIYADQLDNKGRPPWEDFDPERHKPRTTVPAVWDALGAGSTKPAPEPNPPPRAERGYTHDDPTSDGWASAGAEALPGLPKGPDYLWSAHGSSLPFAGVAPGDVPNLAILFHEPQQTSKPPWWYDLSPLTGRCAWRFRGGRPVRGILLKVRSSVAADAAFTPWGVLRQITAQDVLDEGLIVAKPLKGLRALAYAVIFIVPLVIDFILRRVN